MLLRIEQLLVFVLAVQLHQPIGEVLERAGGGERARDEGAASALRRDLAPHDDLFVPSVLEDGFDGGEVLAGADEILRRAPPSSRPTASTRMDLPAPVSPSGC